MERFNYLQIGRGVQGKRWEKNVKEIANEKGLELNEIIVGRDYREVTGNIDKRKFDLIISAIPAGAQPKVLKYLCENGIKSEYLIIEKPGAYGKDYEELINYAYCISDNSIMFLPTYIEYYNNIKNGWNPKEIVYVLQISPEEIEGIDPQNKVIKLRNGRLLEISGLYDSAYHALSLISNYNYIDGLGLGEVYIKFPFEIWKLESNNKNIIVGRDLYSIRKIDEKDITFGNPMRKILEDILLGNVEPYKEIKVDRLPKKINESLDRIIEEYEREYGIPYL